MILTEFVADNDSSLLDEDGDASDWIEIFNGSPDTVNLTNWSLTDDSDDLEKWKFPSVDLLPGEFLVVFASGKNRATAGATLHTNFGLNNGGDYVALVEPDGVTIATEYGAVGTDFPKQELAGTTFQKGIGHSRVRHGTLPAV